MNGSIWEKFWIRKLKNDGFKLTNGTIGGDGVNVTREIVYKRSSTRMMNTYSSNVGKFGLRLENGMFVVEPKCKRCGNVHILSFSKPSVALNKALIIEEGHRKCIKCPDYQIHTSKKTQRTSRPAYERLDYTKLCEELNVQFSNEQYHSLRTCCNCGIQIEYSSPILNRLLYTLRRAVKTNRKCNKCAKRTTRIKRDHLIKAGALNPNFGKVFSAKEKRLLREKNIVQEVNMFDMNGNLIRSFLSVREAADVMKLDRKSITWCCKKKPCHNHVGGYVFRYKGDDSPIQSDGRKLQPIVQKALDGTTIASFPSIGNTMKALGMTQYKVTKSATTKKPIGEFYLEFKHTAA